MLLKFLPELLWLHLLSFFVDIFSLPKLATCIINIFFNNFDTKHDIVVKSILFCQVDLLF